MEKFSIEILRWNDDLGWEVGESEVTIAMRIKIGAVVVNGTLNGS